MTYTVLTIFFYFIWYIIQTLLLYKLHYYWNKRNGQYWIYQVSFNAFVIRWRPWWYAPRPSPEYSCRKSNWCIIWLTYVFLFLPRLAKKTVWLNLMTLHSEKKKKMTTMLMLVFNSFHTNRRVHYRMVGDCTKLHRNQVLFLKYGVSFKVLL